MNRQESDTRSRYLGYLLSLVLIASAGLNVWLASKLTVLRTQLQAGKTSTAVLLGDVLPPLSGHRIDAAKPLTSGSSGVLSFRGNTCTVLYIFSEHCRWCQRNLPHVSDLRKQLQAAGARIVAISFDSDQTKLEEYVRREMPNFEVMSNLTADARTALRVPGTPWTIVVDANGRVLKEWPGAYNAQLTAEVIEACRNTAERIALSTPPH